MKYDSWIIKSKFPKDPINSILRDRKKSGFVLDPSYKDISNPQSINDLLKAKGILLEAISKGEKIGIFMDYDADGVCAGAVLYKALKYLGTECDCYTPQRDEGYGLTKNAIDIFAKKGVKLIVTVDCGIKNIDEVDYARKLGVKVIVTDHHLVGDKIPKAQAVVHPTLNSSKGSFGGYSGAGVAFQLARALLDDRGCSKWFLDLVSISTIADIVPLVADNRIIVKYGFLVLNKTRNMGLKFLIKEAGLGGGNIGSYEVGYILAPRLNAAGRVAKPQDSFKLLISEDKSEAKNLAKKLNKYNLVRQKQLSDSTEKALEIVTKEKLFLKNIIIIKGDWNEGVIGLISGRITSEYHKPSIVLTELDGKLKGSARSISSIDITEMIGRFDNLLLSFGGHKQAAGLSLKKENFNKFKKLIEDDSIKLDKKIFKRELIIDVLVDIEDVDISFAKKIGKLSPFGMGNPQPVIGLSRVLIEKMKLVGKGNNHMSLFICSKSKSCKAILFDYNHEVFEIEEGREYDIAFKVMIDRWNGGEKINLHIIDAKKSK